MMCSDARTVVARDVALYPNQLSLPHPSSNTLILEVLPGKSTDHHPSNHRFTRPTQYQSAMEHGQGDEPGEPEQTGHGVQGEHDPFVEEAAVGLVAAGEDGVQEQVGEGEESEGCDEDEVGRGGGRGGGTGVVEIPGSYCGGRSHVSVLFAGGRLRVFLFRGVGMGTVAIQTEGDDGEDELKGAKRKVQVEHGGAYSEPWFER